MNRLLSCVAIACVAFTTSAQAWSFKEHIQFTRLAATRIINDDSAPQGLRDWLKANTPTLESTDAEKEFFLTAKVGEKPDASKLSGLTWWVCVPDIDSMDRSSPPTALTGRHERFNHYIDLEFLNPDKTKWEFQKDLSSLPKASDVPHEIKNELYVKAGYLPFSVENAYTELVKALKEKRLAPDPTKPEDQNHAVRWAGVMCHYVEDNTQPHHATEDYKSAMYFTKGQSSPNVHAEMEYRMCDDAEQSFPELRAEFWNAFVKKLEAIKDPTTATDPFAATIEVAMASYRALPLIGEAAAASAKTETLGTKKPLMDTEKFFRFQGTVDGEPLTVLDMKAHQTAWAVARAERMLRQAWAEAHPEK